MWFSLLFLGPLWVTAVVGPDSDQTQVSVIIPAQTFRKSFIHIISWRLAARHMKEPLSLESVRATGPERNTVTPPFDQSLTATESLTWNNSTAQVFITDTDTQADHFI